MPAIQSSSSSTTSFGDHGSSLPPGARAGSDLHGTASESAFASRQTADRKDSLAPELDEAIRQIEGLMVESRLMEADRALFLTMEQHGWHRALAVVQERLDTLHHRELESRVRALLDESEGLRLAGDLASAFEKVEKGFAMASGNPLLRRELDGCRERLRLSLAQREKQNVDLLLDDEPVERGSSSHNKADEDVELKTIRALITAGELDTAANQLEVAVAKWGIDDHLKELYGQLAFQRMGRRAQETRRDGSSLEEQATRLLHQAQAALARHDRFKAQLLVAEALEICPGDQQALGLAQWLDIVRLDAPA